MSSGEIVVSKLGDVLTVEVKGSGMDIGLGVRLE
jgi:hypothetical protein